jgi:polar amino acid transport system substrate-binding protein
MKLSHALAAMALSFCVSTSPAFADKLRVTASDWRPYVDRQTQWSGFAVALVSRALERAGYDVTVDIGPWPQSLEDTITGKHDVFATLWFTDERAKSIVFSEPYIESEIVLVRRSDSDIRYREREDLLGLRIGVVDDFAYSSESVDTTGIEIVSSGSVADSVAQLRRGELDLVLADRRVALFEINERALAKSFDVLPDPLFSRGLRIGVSKQRDDADAIVAAFEDEIAKMREDGSFNAILGTFRVSN